MGTNEISEADWKILRELKPLALERLCSRILIEVGATCDTDSVPAHERFLRIYSQVGGGNAEVGFIFNDLRRSNAIQRIGYMRAYNLVADREFSRFSQSTQKAASRIADARIVLMRESEKP